MLIVFSGKQNMSAAKIIDIPPWINDEFFQDIGLKYLSLKDEDEIKAEITACAQIGGAGENFFSNMHRATIKFVAKNQEKILHAVVKTVLYGVPELRFLNVFPREELIYKEAIPHFEAMWKKAGIDIELGPACYKAVSNDKDILVMEDISARSFKVADRLKGLDEAHVNLVLDKLARFHAASAVDLDKNGPLSEDLDRELFNAANQLMFSKFFACWSFFENVLLKLPESTKYIEKWNKFKEGGFDAIVEGLSRKHLTFRVLCHNDLWTNNVLFHYDQNGKPDDLLLIDYQLCAYSTPAIDLIYFLTTSTNLEVKVDKFDDFILFYWTKLTQYLKDLRYPTEKIPSLKQLHLELLKFSIFVPTTVVGIMSVLLMEPNEDASLENMLGGGPNDVNIDHALALYENPRYKAHLAKLLPFLYKRGYLDL